MINRSSTEITLLFISTVYIIRREEAAGVAWIEDEYFLGIIYMSAFAESPATGPQDLPSVISQYFREGREYDTYHIPAGTRLFKSYRDSLEKWTPDKVFPVRGPAYFGFDEANVSGNYGFAFAYITTAPHELLAIDSPKTLAYLWGLAQEDVNVQNALQKSFGFTPSNPVIRRTSDEILDYIIVDFICKNGLHGYAGDYIPTAGGGRFHPECVICGGQINVIINEKYKVPTENYPDGISGLASPVEKHRQINGMLENRRLEAMSKISKRRTSEKLDLGAGTSLNFGDDSDDENTVQNTIPDKKIAKSHFADYGGSRKKRKTRKQRKRTYKQKKNKSRK
jgi:hypothetical protein